MPQEKAIFICQNCGTEFPKWQGQCLACGQWNTLVETVVAKRVKSQSLLRQGFGGQAKVESSAKPLRLSQIKEKSFKRISTEIPELDRVLGGGIVPGSIILVAGEPGIGKSTLLTQVIAKLGSLYISGEESPQQIKMRTKRLKIKEDSLLVLSETNVEAIIQQVSETAGQRVSWAASQRVSKTARQQRRKRNAAKLPRCPAAQLIVVDSIQSLWTERLTGTAGSVGQVRESANILLKIAKKTDIPVFLIGHVTKEGAIAGPKVLEHLVDVVLYLEGDRQHDFRILRCVKNRFGPTDEVGIFQMSQRGLQTLRNPAEIFLSSKANVPGQAITCLMQGLRPMLVEIQGLVVPSNLAVPRRVAQGISFYKLQVLSAVLQKRANLGLGSYDVFVNVAGGLKVEEPAADLAIIAAIASSFQNKKFTQQTVIIGEVGLLGEVREISFLEKRVKEAKSLGFKKIISPKNCPTVRNLLRNLS